MKEDPWKVYDAHPAVRESRERRRLKREDANRAREKYEQLPEGLKEQIDALSDASIGQALDWAEDRWEGEWIPASRVGVTPSFKALLRGGLKDYFSGHKTEAVHILEKFVDQKDKQVAQRAIDAAEGMLSAFPDIEAQIHSVSAETPVDAPIDNPAEVASEISGEVSVEEMVNPEKKSLAQITEVEAMQVGADAWEDIPSSSETETAEIASLEELSAQEAESGHQKTVDSDFENFSPDDEQEVAEEAADELLEREEIFKTGAIPEKESESPETMKGRVPYVPGSLSRKYKYAASREEMVMEKLPSPELAARMEIEEIIRETKLYHPDDMWQFVAELQKIYPEASTYDEHSGFNRDAELLYRVAEANGFDQEWILKDIGELSRYEQVIDKLVDMPIDNEQDYRHQLDHQEHYGIGKLSPKLTRHIMLQHCRLSQEIRDLIEKEGATEPNVMRQLNYWRSQK